MSFDSEYWELQKKRKKKEEEKKKTSNKTSTKPYASRLISPADEIAPIKTFTPTTTIAPTVTTSKKDDERTWFKKGSGGVVNTILGTVADIGEDIGTGIIGMGEKAVDFLAMAGTAMGNAQMSQLSNDELAFSAVKNIGKDKKTKEKEAESIVKKYNTAQKDAKKGTTDFVKKDLYNEEAIAKKIITAPFQKATDINVEASSVLGEKSDALLQSGGQLLATAGLQAMGVPWFLTTGATSFGAEAENALNQGATFEQATMSAAVSAGAEILTEKLSGGIKFGGKTLDDVLLKPLTEKISSKALKTLTNLGVDALGEGAEEVVSGVLSNLGSALYKEDDLTDILFSEEAVDEYIESFIGGAALGGFSSSVRAVANRNAIELTEDEQKVFDKVVEDRIAEETEDGKTISKKKEKEIRNAVLRDMQKGYIDTDTIESVLGGEEYETYKASKDLTDENIASGNEVIENLKKAKDTLQAEYDTLNKMKRGEMTGEQIDRQNALKDKIADIEARIEKTDGIVNNLGNDKRLGDLKTKLGQSVFDLVKDSRLGESYRELERSKHKFEADSSKYENESARQTVQNAIDSGLFRNSNADHDAVDFITKVTSKLGLVCEFTNNEKITNDYIELQTQQIAELEKIPEAQRTQEQINKLAKMKDALEKVKSGKRKVNGSTKKGVITINLDSVEPVEFITGHEVLHNLIKSKTYVKGDLHKAFKSYLGEKEYAKRLDEVKETYEGNETTPDEELVANLVGEYIFNDYDFVMHLATNNQNIFQQAWDSIKHLYKMATVGSKEARDLERVKKTFEKAYKEIAKTGAKVEGTKHDIVALENGNVYVKASRKVINGTTVDEMRKDISHFFNRLLEENSSIDIPTIDGDVLTITKTETADKARDNYKTVNNQRIEMTDEEFTVKMHVEAHIDEVAEVSTPIGKDGDRKAHSFAKDGFTYRKAYFEDFDGQYYEVTLSIGHNGTVATVYNVGKIKESVLPSAKIIAAVGSKPLGKTPSKNSISENSEKSSEIEKHSLSDEQETYFKDSKVRDENGNLKVMYHGTSKGGHAVFDTYGSNYGLFGQGSYFTDNKEIAESYTNKGKGDNKQVYETYLNITNPIDMDAEADVNAWVKALPDADFSNCTTNEDCYRAMEEYFEDEQYPKYEASEIAMDVMQGMGYDGITHIGGGRVNADGTRHQVYIAFEPEQIKNIDNIAPTKDVDIRYSLSETDNKYLSAVESGDTETAQRMVDEAAKKSGYTIHSYHGTRDKNFTEFKKDFIGSRFSFDDKGFFFIDRKSIADDYAHSEFNADAYGRVLDVYLKVKKPLMVDKNFCLKEGLGNPFRDDDAIGVWDAYSEFFKEEAENRKSDGIILDDGMSKMTVVFDPNQIKSAEPITYDGNGNVIPLSERFNAENNDIRYSLSDSDGRELSPAVKKRFANSKAVDENGNLKVLYHGTASGEFTIFDKSKGSVEGDFGSGFYFTDNDADVTDHYEGGGPDFENKVSRRAEQIENEEEIDYDEAEKRARAELYKGSHKFEVYLNIENPAIVGETTLFDNEAYLEEYDESDFDDYEEYIAEVEQLVADDIEKIIWEVESNTDVYSTEGLANVLFEAYYEGGIGVEELKAKINELYLEDSYGNIVGNEVTRQVIESLGYDGIIDPTVSHKWNMRMEEGTTHYIVFKPNQIKSVTNETPTDNPDINLSLSDDNGTSKGYGTFYGRKIANRNIPLADIAPVKAEKSSATVSKTEKVKGTVNEDDYAPMTEAEAVSMMGADKDYINSFTDADMPPEMDAPIYSSDTTSIDEKALNNIAKTVKDALSLSVAETKAIKDIIQKYSTSEYQSEADLFEEIKANFGEKSWSERNEEIANVKQVLRSYKINVSPTIKRDITDYAQFRRRNFGKITFSKEGIPVDTAYMELSGAYPSLFPASITNATDQLLQMVEVANMEINETQTAKLDDESIQEVTELIVDVVNTYKENELLKGAKAQGREFLKNANKYEEEMPKISNDFAPTKQYEAIEPKSDALSDEEKQWAKNKMARADKVDTEEKPKRRSELHQSIVDRLKSKFTEKGFDFDDVLNKAKNLSTPATVDNIPQRVMEKTFGYKQGQILADETVNKVAQNESEGIKWLNSFTDRKNGVLAQISKQYNIKPGSKKSAAAQMYAEGFYVNKNNEIIEYGDRELAIDFPDAKVQANIKGLARDPRIRKIYDDTLNAINESRSRNLYPEIPRLDNYFLHFRAMEDTFSQLGLPFNPNDIRAKDLPTDLNGVTADLKPGQPYFASAKHREGMRTSFDLLGGLERYLSSAKNQVYHIDDIQTLRALRNYIADTYGQAKGLESLDDLTDEEAQYRIEQVYSSHLSTFAKFLNEEANVLAGKTTLIDRGLEGVMGRKAFTFFDTLNKQVGSNMVGWNISSSLTNFLPVAQTFAKTNKFDFTKAFAQTVSSKIGSIFGKTDSFVENNPTIIRRKGAERFHRTFWQKLGDPGYVLMSAVDDISTELIVRTKYNELTRKGMDEQKATFEADKWTSRLMGDRSLGQQPQLYNSKGLGLLTKFQLEVRNQLDSQFYDTIQEAKVSNEEIENKLLKNAKTAAKVTSVFFQLAVVQHLYGMAFESIAGYNPAFDIIDVLIKTLGFDDDEEDEDTPLDNLEEGLYALAEDLPYASLLVGSGRIPISSALPVKQLWSGKDKYGNEKSRKETLKETAPYYLLPTGYGQLKKTAQGLGMFSDDHPVAGSYTDSGNLRFPVEETPLNVLQAGVFGQYASENARYYFDNEISPLKEKQIQEYIDVEMPIKDYWQYREDLKGLETLEDKFDFIADMDLPVEKKNILINNIVDRKEKVDLENYDDFENYEEFDFYAKNTEKYNFLQDNGVSYKEYKSSEDAKENYDSVYSWWKNNPEKVTVSKAVTDNVIEYREYTGALNEIKADKDENGKPISGSAKEKKKAYIWSLPIDYGQKIILYRSLYDSKDDKAAYNQDIIDYLNSRDDISYDEMNTICEELGFTVNRETGYISW